MSSRKLDNIAKIFSVEDKKNYNTFRLSIFLNEKIDSKLLEIATINTLKNYNSYKVKMKSGIFWNYLKTNLNKPIVKEDKEISCKTINSKKNNDFLFKVSYYKNKINIDFCHVLTDGLGSITFLKSILYNYLNLKYNLINKQEKIIEINKDENLRNVNKKLVCKKTHKKGYLIKEKSNFKKNKTYHFILNLKRVKKICRKKQVSITEYLTSLYIYTIYNTIYKKTSNKDIVVTIPIDLRKVYDVETNFNFFTCMNIKGKILEDNITLDKILTNVHNQFKLELQEDNLKKYLSRDVKLGTNIGINIIPLFIKKIVMKYIGKYFNNSTTTLSNINSIVIEEQYRKYVDNIVALVNPGNTQKIKCTICSYQNNLTVTINSNIINNKFEKEFYTRLNKYIGNVMIVGDKILNY